MKQTSAGLPNTCSRCGQPAGEQWWAENDEQAQAGQGVCDTCHQPPKKAAPKPKRKTTTRRQTSEK